MGFRYAQPGELATREWSDKIMKLAFELGGAVKPDTPDADAETARRIVDVLMKAGREMDEFGWARDNWDDD